MRRSQPRSRIRPTTSTVGYSTRERARWPFWTSDTGVDGENPVEIEELDLIPIDPIPPYVWYRDMADFAEGISDDAAGRRLARALEGRRPFGQFKNQLYENHPELISSWHTFRDIRAGAAPSNGS